MTRKGHEPFEGAPFSTASLAVLAQGVTLDPVGSRIFAPGDIYTKLTANSTRNIVTKTKTANNQLTMSVKLGGDADGLA